MLIGRRVCPEQQLKIFLKKKEMPSMSNSFRSFFSIVTFDSISYSMCDLVHVRGH